MLMVNQALGLIEHLPAALPRHVPKVRVFEIERREQLIEPAKLEKLSLIESARATATVEARIEIGDSIVLTMAHLQTAVLPPSLRETGFFSSLIRVAQEDLA